MKTKTKQLEKLENEYLTKLTVPELKSYIIDLVTDYYISISEKDKVKIQTIIATFDKLKDLHEEINVESYINYALITVFIKVILNTDSAINIEEPILKSDSGFSKNIYFSEPTELEQIIEYFTFQEILKKVKELNEANLSKAEIEELFNYKDYVI